MSKQPVYTLWHQASCVIMIFCLIWLTVSLPIVTRFQDEMANLNGIADDENAFGQCEEKNPTGSQEEKSASANSLSEEYLHSAHDHLSHPELLASVRRHTMKNMATTFVKELLSPPPERSLM